MASKFLKTMEWNFSFMLDKSVKSGLMFLPSMLQTVVIDVTRTFFRLLDF